MSVNHWAWLLTVIGFAGYWLNRPSEKLKYATAAILPWYILHQTLIIVFAWWLKPLGMPIMIESIVLLSMTLLGCFLGYELIRRSSVLRFCCGMPPLRKSLPSSSVSHRVMASSSAPR